MTDDELRALAEAATPGPWYAAQPEHANGWWVVCLDQDGFDNIDESGDGGFEQSTASFIAAARDAVPRLLAEKAALTAQVAALRYALEYIAAPHGSPYPPGSLEACVSVRRTVQNVAIEALRATDPAA